MYHSIVESPIGPVLLTGIEAGLTGVYTAEHVRLPAAPGVENDAVFRSAIEQLGQYFAGERQEFSLELAPVGTGFQQRVWQALQRIPYGEHRSYGALAIELGNPNASRAVGLANGRNPISIIVPCHRVVGSTGALTGYAGGLDAKRWLLEHEARVAARVA